MGPPAQPTATVTGGDSSPSSAESSFRELDDVFLQTQTKIWLGEVLHTRFEEKLHISDLLSDGELLFEVSKKLWNMLLVRFMDLRHVKANAWIPVGSRKSSGRYMPYSNVDSFLKVCKVFGMDGIDLFSPSDVVEKRDTRKVCICIRSLSKKARSKKLNVPDFDIVTYTIAMPTDIVGCIRKSWERSGGSIRGPTHSQYKDEQLDHRQSSVATCEQSNELWPENSDESESSSTGHQSLMLYTDTSHINPLYLDLENSVEVHSAVKSHALPPGGLYLDMHEQETDESEQCRYYLEHLSELEESIRLQHVRNGGLLNSMQSPGCQSQVNLFHNVTHLNEINHGHESNSVGFIDVAKSGENDASSRCSFPADNRVEASHISQLLALPTDTNDLVFIEKDPLSNSRMEAESSGSNSTPTSKSGSWKRFSDNFDDVEVSSKTSMSSMLVGRVLDFGPDSKYDEDDPRVTCFEGTELQYYEAEGLDKGSASCYKSQNPVYYERLLHGAALDAEESHIKMELKSSDLPAESLISYWDDRKLYTSICEGVQLVCSLNLAQRNSGDALWVKNTNLIVSDIYKEPTGKITDKKQVATCAGLLDLGPDIKQLEDVNVATDCSNDIVDKTSEDSISTRNCFAIEERCQNSFQRQCLSFQDVGSEEIHTPAVDMSANQGESFAEKLPFRFSDGADGGDKTCHQASTYHTNVDVFLDHKKHANVETIKDERKNKSDYVAKENPDGITYKRAGEKQNKFKLVGPLLKTVAKGTALVGFLFLLHLRITSDTKKEGESGENLSSVQKSNSMQFSSRKGKRGGEVYPAEKLKLGD